jgi:hypothetical protein
MNAKTRDIRFEGQEHIAMMRYAFDQICDKNNWKGPIDCIVPSKAASLYMEAIIFMTGTVPESSRLPDGRFQLVAAGYQAGPCGDH